MIVGIDLGTTHTVVAWADPAAADPPEVLALEQLVAPSELAERPLLPSFLYAAPDEEALPDPFGDVPFCIGEYARRRGQEVPTRLVASAKSWLCHPAVDREAPILPWGAAEDAAAPRLSPVEASTRILAHVRTNFERAFPGRALRDQTIVLTVPASFDEVARELTVRAAESAGLSVRLLEEPQAAFYDYLARSGTEELAALVPSAADSALVLVCDVGGGTTDLSLIRVARAGGEIALERVAVGRHLLLGGDNIDLALAHACERRLVEPPERLEPRRFAALVHACRAAKERLLAPDPPAEVPIRILGLGSGLVGSTLSTAIAKSELESVVLDGFLPIVSAEPKPPARRSALVSFGLPYEADPAITRHVADFLARHRSSGAPLQAVLLNGGLFRSERVQSRLIEAIEPVVGARPRLLRHTDPDLAVARGAVAYGLSLRGRGIRIAGGTAHGYFVSVEAEREAAVRAVCVVPRGAREGERHVAAARPLALRVGQPVRFELYASDDENVHAPGELVTVDAERFTQLPPLVTSFEASGAGGEKELRVVLEGELTPVGTVELACLEEGADPRSRRRFRLAFDLKRSTERAPSEPAPSRSPSGLPEADRLARGLDALDRVFGKSRKDVKPREAKDLWRELERLFGDRASWSGELNRTFFDALAAQHAARRRSPDHERSFWMLAGYCLRPGFGHPKDPERVALLAPLWEQGLTHAGESRGWQAYFVAWRRIAGGLGEEHQTRIRDLLDPVLAPKELKLKPPKGFRPLAPDELLELASWLERVVPEQRALLGHWLIERTWTNRDARLWSALARVGARVPAYASAHYVVPPSVAERWLDHLLREKWREVPTAASAAVQLARKTGDRARDISERVRGEVVRALEASGAAPDAVAAVREVVPVLAQERARWFEDLPVGLRLLE
ncbi:MAG TPA: Hsp70 family protein [Polyangiaceae bacterium]